MSSDEVRIVFRGGDLDGQSGWLPKSAAEPGAKIMGNFFNGPSRPCTDNYVISDETVAADVPGKRARVAVLAGAGGDESA